MNVYRGEYIPGHPKFSTGSDALTKPEASGPVPPDAPLLTRYSAEDDKVLVEFKKGFW
jgi:alcohol oxidase